MPDVKIIRDVWKDFDDSETEYLSMDVNRLYIVSELITMLEEAERLWRDKQVAVCDLDQRIIGGFIGVYLHKGFDSRETLGPEYYQDDLICILG